MNNGQRFVKRAFDFVFSLLGLMFLFPLGCIVAIAVKYSSKGPVFFNQLRIGIQGKPFRCIKFRTMYTGADKLGTITTALDSRITPLGRVLRKFKLDELPQLWNVLIGKMSFVGPRPDVKGYADALEGKSREILKLWPGITGPASLYFKDEEMLLSLQENPNEYNDKIIWPKKVELNLAYLENWGFGKDIGYILITIIPVLDRLFHLLPSEESFLKG